MSYVSNRLVHWAGGRMSSDEQYELLTRKILQPKLLKYGIRQINLCSKYGGLNNYPVEMICFTDIPFSETERHCARYSKFGISFDKSYLVNCFACPVQYVANPFIYQNFSFLFHMLNGIKDQDIVVGSGIYKDKPFKAEEILSRLMYMIVFKQDYSLQEFRYNETCSDPIPGQQALFEDPDSLYFEREWRIVPSTTANVEWNVVIDNVRYFRFKEAYMGPIIMPRAYLNRFQKEREEIFAEYKRNWHPTVLAYEDLAFM